MLDDVGDTPWPPGSPGALNQSICLDVPVIPTVRPSVLGGEGEAGQRGPLVAWPECGNAKGSPPVCELFYEAKWPQWALLGARAQISEQCGGRLGPDRAVRACTGLVMPENRGGRAGSPQSGDGPRLSAGEDLQGSLPFSWVEGARAQGLGPAMWGTVLIFRR